MDAQDTTYYKEGVFTVRAGTRFESSEGTLTLSRDIKLPYRDWGGAGACILMQHPLYNTAMSHGPNLGRLVERSDVDIEEAALGIVAGMARNYRHLKQAADSTNVQKEMAALQLLFN